MSENHPPSFKPDSGRTTEGLGYEFIHGPKGFTGTIAADETLKSRLEVGETALRAAMLIDYPKLSVDRLFGYYEVGTSTLLLVEMHSPGGRCNWPAEPLSRGVIYWVVYPCFPTELEPGYYSLITALHVGLLADRELKRRGRRHPELGAMLLYGMNTGEIRKSYFRKEVIDRIGAADKFSALLGTMRPALHKLAKEYYHKSGMSGYEESLSNAMSGLFLVAGNYLQKNAANPNWIVREGLGGGIFSYLYGGIDKDLIKVTEKSDPMFAEFMRLWGSEWERIEALYLDDDPEFWALWNKVCRRAKKNDPVADLNASLEGCQGFEDRKRFLKRRIYEYYLEDYRRSFRSLDDEVAIDDEGNRKKLADRIGDPDSLEPFSRIEDQDERDRLMSQLRFKRKGTETKQGFVYRLRGQDESYEDIQLAYEKQFGEPTTKGKLYKLYHDARKNVIAKRPL